jgi:IS4 transposase
MGSMMLDPLVARFVEHSPIAVMAQLGLERVLEPEWMDELFERHRGRQYQRELLFSTTVDIVALVALGLRPSVHAAARARKDLGVSLSALYEKINHTEPALGRALVQQSAKRLEPTVEHLHGGQARLCPGYSVRIVDGNCLAPSEKRLKPLRSVRSAALPGRSLVVYDPDSSLVVDVLPCEDGHAGERTLMASLVPTAEPGQLWIADRNFCTYNVMAAWQLSRCAFVVREHGSNAKLTICTPPIEQGNSETGIIYEHWVDCHAPDGTLLRLRRIEIRLETPTDDGDTTVSLLSNLPAAVTALEIAALYRRRWTIENMFQKLEAVLASEIRTLGYPRAALFSFCVAVLAYNVLSMLQAAVETKHRIERRSPAELSLYLVAAEVKAIHAGMMIAIPVEQWAAYRQLREVDFCNLLLDVAARADPAAFRKSVRVPKKWKPRKRLPPSEAGAHVATARALKKRGSTP